VRLAFRKRGSRAPKAAGFAADNHVWLAIDEGGDSVAEQWMLVHDEDSCLYGLPAWRNDHMCAVRDCALVISIRAKSGETLIDGIASLNFAVKQEALAKRRFYQNRYALRRKIGTRGFILRPIRPIF
jgi:hypothetical protein